MQTRSSIFVNNTEYIPAKEAEISFLVAIVGIVTGIIFGFFVLKFSFGLQESNNSLPQSLPATNEEGITPLEYPELPVYNPAGEEQEGLKDISV